MCVRPSTASYGSFSLATGRSPGFGPAPADSFALFTLGFPPAPRLKRLTLPADAARRTVLQKVRGCAHAALPQLVNTGVQVLFHSPHGVLFTFPSQYSALSVTKEYSALRGGPRVFPQGFSCLVVLWIPLCRPPSAYGAFTLSGRSSQFRSAGGLGSSSAVRTPGCTHPGLGSSGSARRYSRNHFCFLFLRLLRCFSSPGSLRTAMDSPGGAWSLSRRVSPFRHPRIYAHLQLPAAFRSLSRLSSALSAKASSLCSFLLNLQSPLPAQRGGSGCPLSGVFFWFLSGSLFWFLRAPGTRPVHASDVLHILLSSLATFHAFLILKIFSVFGFQGTIGYSKQCF